MNFYEKELNNEIARFKSTLQCLTYQKTTIDQFEKLVEAIKYNGIACNYMISAHEHDQSVSLFIFQEVALESQIIKALHISAAFIGIDINSIKAVLDINYCGYGFALPMTNKNIIRISLNNLKQHFSPLDVERILNEAKTTIVTPFFIGVDKAAPDSDVTAYPVKEGTEVTA